MTTVNLKYFVKKCKFKDAAMNEIDIQKLYNYHMYPTESILTTNKGFINIENGAQGGTHWTCFHVKHSKSFYFESFSGQSEKVLNKQLPKPIAFHN